MKTPPKEIIGSRVKLRLVRLEDSDAIFQYASDPEVCRYLLLSPNTPEKMEAYMKEILERYASGDAQQVDWVIESLKTGEVLGDCALHHAKGALVRGGVVLDKKYWNQGYGTEALKLLIKTAFEEYGFTKVQATCDQKNLASEKIMQKAGMKFLGLRNLEVDRGKKRLSKLYEIVLHDPLQQHPLLKKGKILYDPVQPLSYDEWPKKYR